MSDCAAPQYIEVPAKRTADKVPVQFDWHDMLANLWQRGAAYALAARIRPERALSTGLEYEVTTAGVTGNRRPNFPVTAGETVQSGSVVFTSRAMSDASLRATILVSAFPLVEGLTLSDQSDDDLVHTIYAAGGTSGQRALVVNRVTLSNPPGEIKEAAMLLPVQD